MEPLRFVFSSLNKINCWLFYFNQIKSFDIQKFAIQFQKQSEEEDVLLEFYYPDGMGSVKHTLDELEDINSASELKYNKNPSLKLNMESKETVNKPENK